MPRPFFTLIAVLVLAGGLTISGADAADARAVESLRKEVSAKGYLVASIKQARGDWDLVLMRPGPRTAAGCSTVVSKPAP